MYGPRLTCTPDHEPSWRGCAFSASSSSDDAPLAPDDTIEGRSISTHLRGIQGASCGGESESALASCTSSWRSPSRRLRNSRSGRRRHTWAGSPPANLVRAGVAQNPLEDCDLLTKPRPLGRRGAPQTAWRLRCLPGRLRSRRSRPRTRRCDGRSTALRQHWPSCGLGEQNSVLGAGWGLDAAPSQITQSA